MDDGLRIKLFDDFRERFAVAQIGGRGANLLELARAEAPSAVAKIIDRKHFVLAREQPD
jgi:hypothetical protein